MSHQTTGFMDRVGGAKDLAVLYAAIVIGELATMVIIVSVAVLMGGNLTTFSGSEVLLMVLIALMFTPGPFIAIIAARWTGRL